MTRPCLQTLPVLSRSDYQERAAICPFVLPICRFLDC